VAVAEFNPEDVVRHKLVERIVRAYDADAEGHQQRQRRRNGDDGEGE
jgi:phosphate starvation-inducible protein PhoH